MSDEAYSALWSVNISQDLNTTKFREMSLQWTNKLEMMRDLHEAQGTIPVDIHNIIYTNGKPLNQSLIEVNEMNFTHYCDEVEFKSGPDLNLINQMLDMVRQTNTSPDIVSVNAESMFEICKINPSQKTNNKISIDEVKVPKARKQRNVALASILEAISTRNSMDVKHDENASTDRKQKTKTRMKLLKPEDFIIKDELDESRDAVYSIVTISSPNVTRIMFNNKNVKTGLKTFDSYKPTVMADLYYKNYLERSKLKSMHHNFMYETKKLIKAANLEDPQVLCLPQHRHMLNEECIVCKILCKKRVLPTCCGSEII